MNLNKTIFLIRHGTTEYNETDRLQGHLDIGLNKLGMNEARLVADFLQHEPIEIIYHSPLKRTLQTAKSINEYHHVSLTEIPDFVEIDLGEWEGLLYQDLLTNHHSLYQKWLADLNEQIPGGESFFQVYQRVDKGVAEILYSSHKSIIIVGHATVNRAILSHLLNMNPSSARQFRLRNGAISKFLVYQLEESSSLRVIVDQWNDIHHLRSST